LRKIGILRVASILVQWVIDPRWQRPVCIEESRSPYFPSATEDWLTCGRRNASVVYREIGQEHWEQGGLPQAFGTGCGDNADHRRWVVGIWIHEDSAHAITNITAAAKYQRLVIHFNGHSLGPF